MTGTTPSLRSSTSSRAACSASKQSLAMQEQGQASRREVLGTAFATGLTTLLPGSTSRPCRNQHRSLFQTRFELLVTPFMR